MPWREDRTIQRVRAALPIIFLLCALPGLVGWVSRARINQVEAQDQPIGAEDDRLAILQAGTLMQTSTDIPALTPAATSTPVVPKSASTAGLVCGAILLVLIIIGGVGWSTYRKRT